MVENDNTAVVRRWFEEVWNQRRLATIDELLAPDAVAHDLGGPGSSVCGPAEFRRAAEILHRAFGELHLIVHDIFGVGDRVAVRLTARMKNTGPLGNLPPTGNIVTTAIMCMIHLRNGKIVEGWNFWDVTAALRAANAPAEQITLL
jgi:predicted ester cyclase